MRIGWLSVLALVVACKPGPVEAVDLDGDGIANTDDCNDQNPAVGPGVDEICDGLDNNCDGQADEGLLLPFYPDSDKDGYGADAYPVDACAAPADHVAEGGDCDDTRAEIHPDANESDCSDRTDFNCDGSVAYDDKDADGVPACEDCDDGDALVRPGAREVCNDDDDDCDGEIDEDAVDAGTWYADNDSDGYGTSLTTTDACDAPAGYVDVAGDCDDKRKSTNPGADESCNGIDEDCDGVVDDSAVDALTAFPDADGDGWGDSYSAERVCDVEAGYVELPGDCDDGDDDVYPGADELCNGADDDCDGSTDEEDAVDPTTWYLDDDGDGYGVDTDSKQSCDAPAKYTDVAGDCDDGASAVNPGATETCNFLDDDCDSEEDEGFSHYFPDLDSDGQGAGTGSCTTKTGYVSNDDDCDDTNELVYDGAEELCDGVQNDCGISPWTTAAEAGTVSTWDGSEWTAVDWSAGAKRSPVLVDLVDGETIYVCPGTWFVNLTADGVDAAVVGRHGRDDTLLDGALEGSVAYVTAGGELSLEGITFTNGFGTNDYPYWDTSGTGTTYTHGGGLYVDEASTANVDACRFEDNDAYFGGGIANKKGTITVTDTLFEGNTSRDYGGGLYMYNGTNTVDSSTFEDNSANNGSALHYYGDGSGSFDFSDSLVTDNGRSSYNYGAVWIQAYADSSTESVSVNFDSVEISGNSGYYYPGMYFYAYAYNGGKVTADLTDVTLDSNLSTYERVAYIGLQSYTGSSAGTATLTVDGLIVTNNESSYYSSGAYIYNYYSTLTIKNSEFSDNTGNTAGSSYYYGYCYGGGLQLYTYQGTTTLTDTSINDNVCASSSTSSYGYGGGLYAYVYGASSSSKGKLELEDVEISGNSGVSYGGGAYITGYYGSVALTGTTTIHSNTATTSGGGIYATSGSSSGLSISCAGSSSTTAGIYGNTATSYGGGVHLADSYVSMTGSKCDMGDGSTLTDNYVGTSTKSDIYIGSTTKTYGNNADFTCSSGSCTP